MGNKQSYDLAKAQNAVGGIPSEEVSSVRDLLLLPLSNYVSLATGRVLSSGVDGVHLVDAQAGQIEEEDQGDGQGEPLAGLVPGGHRQPRRRTRRFLHFCRITNSSLNKRAGHNGIGLFRRKK